MNNYDNVPNCDLSRFGKLTNNLENVGQGQIQYTCTCMTYNITVICDQQIELLILVQNIYINQKIYLTILGLKKETKEGMNSLTSTQSNDLRHIFQGQNKVHQKKAYAFLWLQWGRRNITSVKSPLFHCGARNFPQQSGALCVKSAQG